MNGRECGEEKEEIEDKGRKSRRRRWKRTCGGAER